MSPATVLTFDGIKQPVAEWALDYGIAPAVIVARLERGLSVEQAITKPMVTAPGQKLNDAVFNRYIRRRYPAHAGLITFNGKSMNVGQWAKHTGVNVTTLRARLADGWSAQRALTTQPGAQGRRRPGGSPTLRP
ncbi:hypothetical protein FJ937_11800 [Mesorhizobium sp. B2-4-4]|uniref:hypothetical protein n=1 Tax=Mesorhizobium sp. B2-4-4 TaxID=2589945 RepID=UPI00112A4813|nr:hypothetical protein [Mesorhizobium sp. B2-4-4]TPL52040.1 hypothetical protein FJ937_11800 [Mesorhizobium sp. B2-4-4]